MKKLLVLPLLAFLLLSSCQIENPTYPFRVKGDERFWCAYPKRDCRG
jgi:hypothetical protein